MVSFCSPMKNGRHDRKAVVLTAPQAAGGAGHPTVVTMDEDKDEDEGMVQAGVVVVCHAKIV